MAIDLTTIFGTEINVYAQPVRAVRQYAGFPGAHGLTSMHLGTRGYPIIVSGKIATAGIDYAAARLACQAAIDSIEVYMLPGVGPLDYSFFGVVFFNAVFEEFRLVPDNRGKVFHWTYEGYVTADFVAILRSLI